VVLRRGSVRCDDEKQVLSGSHPVNVADLMSSKVVEARVTDTLRDGIWFMEQHGVRHLLVRDEDGALAGIVSDRDLRLIQASPVLQGAAQIARALDSLLLGQAMTGSSSLVSVSPNDDVTRAAGLLLDNWISALPVTNAGEVVGILSTTDVLRMVAGRCDPAM